MHFDLATSHRQFLFPDRVSIMVMIVW